MCVVSAGFRGLLQTWPKKEQEKLIGHYGYFVEAYGQVKPGLQRARLAHKNVDTLMGHWFKDNKDDLSKIKCKKGCWSCCSIYVTTTEDEARLLADRVKNGVKISMETLEKQAAFGDDWVSRPQAEARCVFLGDENECRVYKDRPSACRTYHVISDPVLCNRDVSPGADVMSAICGEAEAASSAAMEVSGAGSLPEMLLKALGGT
jgi:Fe-S-cluster containining protein